MHKKNQRKELVKDLKDILLIVVVIGLYYAYTVGMTYMADKHRESLQEHIEVPQ